MIVRCVVPMLLLLVACSGVEAPRESPATPTDAAPDVRQSAIEDAGVVDVNDRADARHDGADGSRPHECRVIRMPAIAPRHVNTTREATTTRVGITAPVPELTGSPQLPASLTLAMAVPNGLVATIDLACPTPGQWCANPRTLDAVYNGGDHYDSYGLFSGSITVSPLADKPRGNELSATTTALRFRRLRLSPSSPGRDEFVPGGDCIDIEPATIAVSAPVGLACTSRTDCATGDVCAPTTLTCQHSECRQDADCGGARVCEPGDPASSETNVCFDTCVPFGSPGCAAGAVCRRSGVSSSVGICVPTGPSPGGPGATCSPWLVTTGCAADLACPSGDPSPVCSALCDHYAAAPGCAAGKRCLPEDVCGAPPASADGAALDAPCAVEGAPCADDGRRYRGACRREFQSPNLPPKLVCRQVCIVGVTACAFGRCQMGMGGRPSACSLW